MRFYLKLLLMIALFAGASSSWAKRVAGDLAYGARTAVVVRFGSKADLEALVDDTQRAHAQEQGQLKLYEAGKRYRQLLAEHQRKATRERRALTDDELEHISAEAYGPLAAPAMHVQDCPSCRGEAEPCLLSR